jgi:hypothetical protein
MSKESRKFKVPERRRNKDVLDGALVPFPLRVEVGRAQYCRQRAKMRSLVYRRSLSNFMTQPLWDRGTG